MERSFIVGWGAVMRKRLAQNAIARARALRNGRTDAEGLLWRKLRDLNGRGYHFRRQVPFRGYTLDFAEHSACIVIELDGSQHGLSEQRERDDTRDAVLSEQGYLVLRFSNVEVFRELERVTDIIFREVERRRPPPEALRASTSPRGGGR
jgi:very-short-patch-repair endonuclease